MITVHVNLGENERDQRALLDEAVRAALKEEAVEEAEISLTLLEDGPIRAMNRHYLGKDRPTDVIAFALHEDGEPPLGDIYVGLDQARRQAEELGIPLREELMRLAIHGTLHVLGRDHPQGPEREESPMFLEQEALLRRLRASE